VESFVTACEVASQRVHKSIVNQLLAVDNFLVFKRMMISRNKQLNEEAMKQFKETSGAPSKEDALLEEKLK
jgi:hypothetical protein